MDGRLVAHKLAPWLHHHATCAHPGPCTCGLQEALREIREGVQATRNPDPTEPGRPGERVERRG